MFRKFGFIATSSLIAIGASALPDAARAQSLVDVCTGLSVDIPVLAPVAESTSGLLAGVLDPVLNAIVGDVNTNIVGALSGQNIGVTVLDEGGGTVLSTDDCNLVADDVVIEEDAGIAIGGGTISSLGGTSNPLAAAANSEMLAVVVFAVFVGMAFVASSNKARLEPLQKLFEAMLEVSMTVVKWAMHLTPLAVFGLTAQLVARMGIAALSTLAAYVGLVLAGLLALLLLYLLLVAVLGRMNPIAFLKAIFPVQLLAFSTSSSAAVMPLSMETARNRLGTPGDTASFVIPLAATMNMAGTALYQSIAVIFVAQVAGVPLSTPEVALLVLSLVAASIGAPGAPGVSVAILSGMLVSFGIPAEGLVFVLGVDRVLDMSRTVVNVTGDLAACRILSRNRSDPETGG